MARKPRGGFPAPKPVTYGGLEFRSTLEARWAVFFDAAGIEWRYEPKWFSLPSGPYLPDFLLPKFDEGLWVEIKPAVSENAIRRLEEFAQESTTTPRLVLLLTADNLRVPDGTLDHHGNIRGGIPEYLYFPDEKMGRWDADNLFAECSTCHAVWPWHHGNVGFCFCGRKGHLESRFNTALMRGAFQAALRERF